MQMIDRTHLFPIFFAINALCLVAGCPATPAPSPTPPVTQDNEPTDAMLTPDRDTVANPEPAPTDVAKDDADAVSALEALGVTFQKDAAGNVTGADCKNAGITDEQIVHFQGLPNLTQLSLENAEITDAGLDVVQGMTQLKDLGLRRCSQITDVGLAKLAGLPNLERLHLLYTKTTDDGLEGVGRIETLKVLDLRGCTSVGNAGIQHLEGMKNLVDLKLRCPAVKDGAMASIGKLTKLRYLALEDCVITDEGLPPLGGLKDLRVLNVMRTIVSDDGLQNFADHHLQDLRVRDTAVTGPGLEHLTGSHESLKYLDISETLIDNEGVSKIAPFTNLETLILWNGSMDDDGIAHLTGLTMVKELDLQGCSYVTSAAAEHLLKLQVLETLNLAETRFDDDGFLKLTALKNLKSIAVGRTDVSRGAIEKFKVELPDCEVED